MTDIIYGNQTIEKNTVQVIYCRGFRKFLNIKDCTREKCKYHYDRSREEARQGDTAVQVIDRVLCGYPRWITIEHVCEVE